MYGVNNISKTINSVLYSTNENLSGAGDLYIVTDTRKNPRKELDKIRILQQYNIEPYTPDNAVMSESGTVLFPVKDLNFDRKNFQNRETDFSDESVLKIIKAVKSGKFNWSIFDAITIWQNPTDGKFYVLSGHSRSEAFKRLADMGAQADGKDFSKIPAKIFKGTLDEARELALNSNTLSTKETNFERANYYRALYNAEISKGRSKAEATNLIMPIIKEREGQNANSIFYISFLNPNGIFYDALRQLQNAPTQDRERLKVIGEWVGRLRKDRSKLTDFHERELFNYLITEGNYNKTVSNYADLLKRIDTALLKMVDEKGNFQPEQSLNLKKNIVAESNEKAFLQELDRLKRVAADEDNLYNQKLAEFRNRQKIDSTITDNQILKAVEPYRQRAILAKADYNAFRQKRAQYIDADRRQMSLFGLKDSGLGKPTIKFEFENNDELKNFLKENKENFIDSEVEDAEIVEDEPDFSRKSLRGFQDGKPASIFNCPESRLVCKGFIPTYKKLESYNHLIDDATGENRLVGYGFDKTTKELLIDTVNKYYKQVYKLAEHLKADTVAQTCFNIWHWEHCNLKYNYDSPGKEEIRTPSRTWKDRFNGIDCDCLAVFTASILKCLGFPADFEIVAFNGSDKYAHIFITCAGVVIDRVLPVFNQRAPLITKTLKMQIPVYSLNGLSGSDKAVIALSGLYSSTLSKIFSHTATADDVINHRKTQLLLNLADKDNNGYRFAVILMPFVKAIDDSGAFYFDNSKIADIAKKGEAEIISLERRNATEAELSGLFKKIGKAIKNAAKSVGNAVKTVAKGTVKAATSVVKSTANVVKSSANLVKAGVQAATGNKSAAKSTLQKAVSQAKSAVVNPVKTSVSVTKNVVKATVVEPTKTAVKDTIDITKETVKIAGKLFKVILIKINPVTILIRNSLRLLIAINFLGLATRLNVANMTESEAAKVGVSAAQYKEAKTAYDRVVRFFVKWGGKKENIERAIRNGAKRKALFKKDYNKNSKIVETGEDEATLSGTAPILCGISGLGEGVTIASALAAVGAFIAKIWGWVKNIVVKVANVAGNVKDKITQFTGGNSNSNGETSNPEDSNIVVVTETEEKNNNKWLVPVLVGGGLLTLLLTSGGRKKK